VWEVALGPVVLNPLGMRWKVRVDLVGPAARVPVGQRPEDDQQRNRAAGDAYQAEDDRYPDEQYAEFDLRTVTARPASGYRATPGQPMGITQRRCLSANLRMVRPVTDGRVA
jgi:hypothetical protein